MILTPLNILENHLTIYAKVYIWCLLCIGLYDRLGQYYTDGFVKRLEIRKYETSNFVLFQNYFVYSESLEIPHEFLYGFFYFNKNIIGIFIRD